MKIHFQLPQFVYVNGLVILTFRLSEEPSLPAHEYDVELRRSVLERMPNKSQDPKRFDNRAFQWFAFFIEQGAQSDGV